MGSTSHPHTSHCDYCKEELKHFDLKDIWPISDDEILEVHELTRQGYKEYHDLEDCYLNLLLDSKSIDVYVHYCTNCGWWRLIKDICISAEQWQIWDIFYGCVGTLKNLDCDNVDISVKEVRDYLASDYKKRFSIHPKVFEDVVGSVFKSVGYHSIVTGYSNDGGIDVILSDNDNQQIGVQVKRQKNKIKVEQIRAFAGALILNGYTKGVYITTSDFQRGAEKAAKEFSLKTLPIELINADRFYDALKIAQKKEFDLTALYNLIERGEIKKLHYYGWDTPRNSL